ncbi:hypothetical protein A3Q56_04089, partial [Intoshia linei]
MNNGQYKMKSYVPKHLPFSIVIHKNSNILNKFGYHIKDEKIDEIKYSKYITLPTHIYTTINVNILSNIHIHLLQRFIIYLHLLNDNINDIIEKQFIHKMSRILTKLIIKLENKSVPLKKRINSKNVLIRNACKDVNNDDKFAITKVSYSGENEDNEHDSTTKKVS